MLVYILNFDEEPNSFLILWAVVLVTYVLRLPTGDNTGVYVWLQQCNKM